MTTPICPPCRIGQHDQHQIEVMDHQPCECPQCRAPQVMITTKVTRDGEVLAELEDEDSPFVWLLKHQGQSVYYALR